MTALVIGYGNELRRDDGAGPAVARRCAVRAGIAIRTPHQLTPELAADVAACDRVVFVDAAVNAARHVQARPLAPADRLDRLGHVGDPAFLLHLSNLAFGRAPAAWLVTVPARDLGFGAGLAEETEAAVEEAAALVEALCTNSG